MRERVTALGGQLAIGAATGQGVRLDAHIPLQGAS
jgi:signal transduction histidine kinase